MRRCAGASIFLLVAAAAAPAPAAAQGIVYTVRGLVRDLEGAPIAGVEIILESPRRSTVSRADGVFVLDSVPGGRRRLMARRIGYLAVNPLLQVPLPGRDSLDIRMIPLPQLLPPVEVTTERRGLYGVVGDTGYHALPGTLVEVLGGRVADTTDEHGRFAFPDLRDGQYMVRFSREGYYGRMMAVELYRKGIDLSIHLSEYRRGRDWVNSIEANAALADLGVRLATEPRRNRMTRAELARFGTMALCDIPKLRSMVGDDPNVILRGSIWYRNSSLCGWSADQMDLLEYGVDPCREAWRSVADVLGMLCGPQRGVSIMMGPQSRRGSYVVMWPRM